MIDINEIIEKAEEAENDMFITRFDVRNMEAMKMLLDYAPITPLNVDVSDGLIGIEILCPAYIIIRHIEAVLNVSKASEEECNHNDNIIDINEIMEKSISQENDIFLTSFDVCDSKAMKMLLDYYEPETPINGSVRNGAICVDVFCPAYIILDHFSAVRHVARAQEN